MKYLVIVLSLMAAQMVLADAGTEVSGCRIDGKQMAFPEAIQAGASSVAKIELTPDLIAVHADIWNGDSLTILDHGKTVASTDGVYGSPLVLDTEVRGHVIECQIVYP